jgi:hypothetical protein
MRRIEIKNTPANCFSLLADQVLMTHRACHCCRVSRGTSQPQSGRMTPLCLSDLLRS